MKKLFILFILSGIFFSCSNSSGDDEIRQNIKKHKQEIIELEDKISDLETRLSDNGNNVNTTKVRVIELNRNSFSRYFEATGELEAIAEAFISPEVSGQITSIKVAEGQRVKRGQVLAKLNTSLIEKNITEVKTQLELAKIIYEKQSDLWNKEVGSERQYLETKNNYEGLQNKLATLQEQYNMSIIRSPINGNVEDIILKKGELASPGMQLMQIIDLDKLHVSAKLSEAYLPVISEGDIVDITFPTYPDIVLQEKVTRVGNVINKQNRTFKVEVEINNKDGRLKPNLLANIKINDYNTDEALVVPSLVVREDVVGSYLYVAESNSDTWTAVKKYIQTGRSYLDNTEVLSGLNEDDLVITDGYSNVSDGAAIEITK